MMINPIQAVTSRAMWKTLGLVVVMIMVLVVFGGLIYGCVFIENSVGARVELASIRQGSQVNQRTQEAQQAIREDMRETERKYRAELAGKDREIAQLRVGSVEAGVCQIGCTLPEILQ